MSRPAMLIVSDDGIIESANAAARELLGECVGRRCAGTVGVRADGHTVCSSDCVLEATVSGSTHDTRGSVRGTGQRVTCAPVGDRVVVSMVPIRRRPPFEPLTPREREVLALVAEGLTNQGIAERLGVSFSTSRTHVEHLRSKLGARSRAEAVAVAVAHGLLEVS